MTRSRFETVSRFAAMVTSRSRLCVVTILAVIWSASSKTAVEIPFGSVWEAAEAGSTARSDSGQASAALRTKSIMKATIPTLLKQSNQHNDVAEITVEKV